jgi:ABC transport system ATP-binding/permease protein
MARLGNQVFELNDVSVAFNDAPPILNDVNLLIGPGDRLAIVGANGAGKSTLLDLLAGVRHATSGRLVTGPTVVVGYYDQHASDLDPSATVREVVAGPFRPPGSPEDLALMQRFWFTGSLPFTAVRELSGGERRRLQLLAILAQGPNVLLLDEPTNDLDLETLRVLEEFLDDWPGTLIVVSHDRAFLEQMTDTVLHITPSGSIAEVPGGLEAWVQGLLAPSPRRASPSDTVEGSPAAAEPTIPLGRQLRDAEKEMTRLQRQCDKLSEHLLTVTDHLEAAALGAELRSLRDALHAAEEAWLLLAAGA